jgi:hypothetical protein
MMGLDITAYKNVKLVGTAKDGDEYEEKFDWRKTDYIWAGQAFIERLPPIQPGGVYEYESSFGFRVGAYSYYNRFRANLCRLALGVSPDSVWANYKRFEGRPFAELVNFSDCEGVLGTEVCKKLLKDFEAFQEEASRHTEDYFLESYNNWRRAFEYASDNGYIDFH